MLYFNIIYFVLVGLALFIIGQSIRDYKGSSVGSLLIYFLNGILLLGFIRLFFALVNFGIIKIDEVTLMVFWHLMFYVAMSVFLIATGKLVKIVSVAEHKESFTKSIVIFLATLGLFGLLFILALPTEKFLIDNFEGTIWDSLGVLHFIAFAFAGFVSYNLLQIHKKFEGNIKSIAFPMIFSIAILSIIHLWELLTESWKIIHLEGEVGETVEVFLWIPVYFLITYAFWKFREVSKIKS